MRKRQLNEMERERLDDYLAHSMKSFRELARFAFVCLALGSGGAGVSATLLRYEENQYAQEARVVMNEFALRGIMLNLNEQSCAQEMPSDNKRLCMTDKIKMVENLVSDRRGSVEKIESGLNAAVGGFGLLGSLGSLALGALSGWMAISEAKHAAETKIQLLRG